MKRRRDEERSKGGWRNLFYVDPVVSVGSKVSENLITCSHIINHIITI